MMGQQNLQGPLNMELSPGESLRSTFNNYLENQEDEVSMGYEEFIGELCNFLNIDSLEPFGINDLKQHERFKSAALRILTDFEAQVYVESREHFTRKPVDVRRTLLSLVYRPEEYGVTWGWREVEVAHVINEEEKMRNLTDFVEDRAKERVYAAYSWNEVAEMIKQNQQNLPADILEEMSKYNGTHTFAGVQAQLSAKFLELDNARLAGQPFDEKRHAFLRTFNGRVFGGGQKMLMRDSGYERMVRVEAEELLSKLTDGDYQFDFTLKPDEFEDDDVMSAVEKKQYVAKMGRFRKREPEIRVEWSTVDKSELIDEMEFRRNIAEGKFVGERYVGLNEMRRFKSNPYGRLVPLPTNTLDTPIALPLDNLEGYDKEQYYLVAEGNLQLFPDPSGELINDLNKTIDYCIKNNEELVLFVPTCPCDQHALVQNGSDTQIAFTGGNIVEGISWTGQNTIDGLSVLLPKLLNQGLKVKVVFATGDMEWTSGNTRGMEVESEFYNVLDKNHPLIMKHMQGRLGLRSEVLEEVDGRQVRKLSSKYNLGESQLTIEVDGIMELANKHENSKSVWGERQYRAREQYAQFQNTEKGQEVIQNVLNSRRAYYIRARGAHEFMDEGEYIGSTMWHLEKDIIDYIAFHQMALDLHQNGQKGVRNTIVFAGDSRPLELLASQVTDSFYMNVVGNYDGAN